jgi:hypothetical protein
MRSIDCEVIRGRCRGALGRVLVLAASLLATTPVAAQTPTPPDTLAAPDTLAVPDSLVPPDTLVAAPPAAAQTPVATQTSMASLYDKLQVSFSLPLVILNADVRIDSKDGTIGTEVDAEEDLGLPTTNVEPRLALRWRLGRRHEVETGYQFVRRSVERTLERNIEFGDTTFDVGLRVKSTMDTDQAFLTYRFALMAHERTQVGVGLGLGAVFAKLELDGLSNSGTVTISQHKSITGPLGSLGLYGRFLSGDRWYFEADARYVKVDIGRLDARIAELNGAARYSLSRLVALEAGYGISAVKLDIGPKTRITGEEGIFSGLIKYSLQNVRLGVVLVP